MESWKYAILHMNFVYKLTNDEDVFWMAQNKRQEKIKQAQTMGLTCIQKIFSVLNHKARHERTHGEISH